ncbi:MAG TPA: DUF3536 domain-containing protein [Thermomicrobiaceae bacterium]|nr:DUF3536 domain-containing protein [Thermomicrobiaceae bacterium]
MPRYLVIHGHFYQPPRHDPATGEIPREPEAAPYHDFNEKILAECYRPNAELGNFDRMSFDLGPTLGEWLRQRHPEVLRRIGAADRAAVARAGFGNALMQSFHHTILPLATARDRRTELRWGGRWFEHVFGRRPRGIWLPETAVDTATLEACADEGLAFTILSPEQAAEPIDSRYPYRVSLPTGREFGVVFYEGGLSGTVSFDPIATNSAGDFLRRFVLPRYGADDPVDPEVIAIASDGEVYGHHHRFKDYFLQDLLYARAEEAGLDVVSLEQLLALSQPEREVAIHERSSWGCAHQLRRWSGDCDCTPGSGQWKRDLRRALDRLAACIDELTEREAGVLDVWALRDDYVDVVIGAATLPDWLSGHGLAPETDDARRLSRLLEAQHHRLAMYASCAFYWDDLTRIEAGYGVRSGLYAAGLLDRAFGVDLTAAFAADLDSVVGWKSDRSAAELYASAVR